MTPTAAGVFFYLVVPVVSTSLLILFAILSVWSMKCCFVDGDYDFFPGVIFGPVLFVLVLLATAYCYDLSKTCAPPLWRLPRIEVVAKP